MTTATAAYFLTRRADLSYSMRHETLAGARKDATRQIGYMRTNPDPRGVYCDVSVVKVEGGERTTVETWEVATGRIRVPSCRRCSSPVGSINCCSRCGLLHDCAIDDGPYY